MMNCPDCGSLIERMVCPFCEKHPPVFDKPAPPAIMPDYDPGPSIAKVSAEIYTKFPPVVPTDEERREMLEWDRPMTSKEAARYHMTKGFVAAELYDALILAPPGQVEEAMRDKSSHAYCEYIRLSSLYECCGEDQKMKDGSFGKMELNAHRKAREWLGKHKAYADALSVIKAALARPTTEQCPACEGSGREPIGEHFVLLHFLSRRV